jgi:hypothetical protein
MIVSASRRTDIPAFYADWLMGRIEAGYCLVRNPFDARSLRRVSLEPDDIDFLVLWTRDPRPLAPHLRELEGRGLRFYFQMTITGYPSAIEPGSPPLDEAIGALRDISDRIGPDRALWRYDPIVLARGLDADFHKRNFERIAAALEGNTRRVTLSVVDEYSGTRSRLAAAGFPGASFELPDYESLLADIASTARARGMRPVSCAERSELASLGLEAGSCVDRGLAAALWPAPDRGQVSFDFEGEFEETAREGSVGAALHRAASRVGGKDPCQRAACLCAKSVDIGAYGTCPRGCAYCYANRSRGKLEVRLAADEAL